METTQEKLSACISFAKRAFFENPDSISDQEALGVLIAVHFKWDGRACFETLTHALEDANYHSANRALKAAWDTCEERAAT